MAYKEPHFDKTGARAFVEALGAANAGTVKKSTGAKKSPAKRSTGTKGKK